MYQDNQLKLLPIGMQTYSKLVEERRMYIDKTALIYRLTHSGAQYVFLSRPRRFGKSLLVSTLHSYFAGEDRLFVGTAMEKLEKEWTHYPVLHFDMSGGKHFGREELERYLRLQLEPYEAQYGLKPTVPDTNLRLSQLIVKAHEVTGEKVVVLIDEYDAPLLDVVHEDVQLPVLRKVMRNFYSPLKACDPHLRFVFLTGITKFSQLSIFSELNNIRNISMMPEYAALCGITREELLTQFKPYTEHLAERMAISYDEAVRRLTERYDGYHFTWPSPDIFNPFSLLNAFEDCRLENYWFGSGTPTYLIEMLRKFEVLPTDLNDIEADATEFDAPTERMESCTPLLYQSGYLTIKDYDPDSETYTLGLPNREIRVGLMRSLLPAYIAGTRRSGPTTIRKMYKALLYDDLEGTLTMLQEFLATVPYCDNTHYEGHYQQMLYIIFSLFGHFVDVEVRTLKGRVDMVINMRDKLYVMEIKTNATAQSALDQILTRRYFQRFTLVKKSIVKVGINFSVDERNITSWTVE